MRLTLSGLMPLMLKYGPEASGYKCLEGFLWALVLVRYDDTIDT
jgi:hypothetical protein